MLTIAFRTMGCGACAFVDSDTPAARAALESLPAWFAARESRLSRFRPTSALSRLNVERSVVAADDVLWSAVDVSLRVAAATGGLVTPTVLPALRAAGYDRSFDQLARTQEGPIAPTQRVPDWRAIARDPVSRTIRLPPGAEIDLAGTAKSSSVDQAASLLARLAPALVDVGGDVAVSGVPRLPWPVAVDDPRGGERPQLELLLLRRGGVATSGRDYRRWTRSGVEQHHLIDPRTGAPAKTDVWSATVVASTVLDADCAAKRVLLEGHARGMAWIDTRPDLAALVVREDGQVLRSARLERHAWRDAA